MVSKIKFHIYSTVLILFILSCGSDSGNSSEMENSDINELSFELDGMYWETSQISASVISNVVGITAIGSNGQTLAITIEGAAEKLYDLIRDGNASFIKDSESIFETLHTKAEFHLSNINEQESTLSGTFDLPLSASFRSDMRMIKNGNMINVKYISSDISNNQLAADVDGSLFNPNTVRAISKNGYIQVFAELGIRDLEIRIPIGTNEGSYEIGLFETIRCAFNPRNTSNELHAALSGSLDINTYDFFNRNLEASFSFISQSIHSDSAPKYQIQNGRFKVSY